MPVAGPPATTVQSGKPQRDFAMAAFLGTSVGVFVGLTVIIAGGAAIMTGRALADGWKAPWQVVFACFGLALANRFLVYALFDGDLLSPSGFLIGFVVLTALALLAWRVTLVRKMVSQYPWRYERTSLFQYRERPGRA
jgi:branched-chain amino acid transport system ATP-binding protein